MNAALHGGLVIAHFRKLKGISQTELSKKIGVYRVTLSAWERQRSEPRYSEVFNITRRLDFSDETVINFTLSRGD